MTLEELYERIEGNYEQALNVMRKDKLIDRYVRKFNDSDACDKLLEAGAQMDAKAIYESAHALKGVCANLGFDKMASAASEVTEEFRPGNARTLSDEEVQAKIEAIGQMNVRTVEGIKEYIG